nr:hypothetical protein [Escherichia coli]
MDAVAMVVVTLPVLLVVTQLIMASVHACVLRIMVQSLEVAAAVAAVTGVD